MEVPRPEHPRPDFQRSDWINLNGPWQFEIDKEKKGMEGGYVSGKDLRRLIVVPFPPESRLSGVHELNFMNCVWYRRKIRIPLDWSGARSILHFGAIDYESWVWVNGRPAIHHKGGYTPFECDITEFVENGQDAEIVVRVLDDNRAGLQACGKQSTKAESYGCHYTRVTGIWQTVWLEKVPSTYISRFRFIPDPAHGRVFLTVNATGLATPGKAEIAVFQGDKEISKSGSELKLPSTSISLDVPQLKMWSPEDPVLYPIRLELKSRTGESDSVSSYFGARSFTLEQHKTLLNGRPRFLRMVLDQGYYSDGIYTAASDEALRRDVLISKEMGFDGARLHQKVFEPRFLYWCDLLGYLVTGEYGDWGADIVNPSTHEDIMNEWSEVVQRDFNHPSIVIWTPFNERTFGKTEHTVQDFIRNIVRLTRALDPTRPIIDTSGYIHVETDIYDAHDYEQDPLEFRSHYDRFGNTGLSSDLWRHHKESSVPYRGQPFIVSEYGGTWWNPGAPEDEKRWGYGQKPSSIEEFLKRYRALTEALLMNPRVSGFAYTQLYDVEQEVNGLCTYDRKPKFNLETIREVNSQKAAIESESLAQ